MSKEANIDAESLLTLQLDRNCEIQVKLTGLFD
jgi:hypothetical protein